MPVASNRFLSLCIIAVAACAPQEAALPPVDTAADVAAVNAVREAEVADITSGNVAGAYLATDAVIMPPGEPAVSGRDAIGVWMGEFVAQFTTVVNYTNTEVTVSGDWAFETYSGTLALTPVGGGETMNEVLKGIHVYRREADGTWKMVYDVWNSDAPPPEM